MDEGDDPQHWLARLRDGLPWQKTEARMKLAGIFERRGMLDEAIELLVANAREGDGSAELFRWLSRLYRAQGDEVTAMQAAAEAAKYMPSQPETYVASPLAPQGPPPAPSLATLPVSYLPEAEGQCPSCGYVNRHQRAHCKRCREPLSAMRTAGPSGFDGPAYVGQQSPVIVQMPVRSGPSTFETRVRTYKSTNSYQRDAAKMAGQGWMVSSTTSRQPRAGCLRILTLGIWTVVFPPKPELVVTYSRQTS